MISKRAYEALVALRSHGAVTSRDFAKLMYPEDPKWNIKGNHDNEGGYKLVYAAGNWLARLYVKGLVKRWHPHGRPVHWIVSDTGIQEINNFDKERRKP